VANGMPLSLYLRESSILNTKTGYPDFGVFIVIYWIDVILTLVVHSVAPTFKSENRHVSKLILYLFGAVY
jgi:hypothetical protein